MALDLAGRVELNPPANPDGNLVGLNAFASFDGRQWASLCPELDIASVGATAEEAIDNLITAVTEAVEYARENNLEPGHPVPPDELREFLIGSQLPFVGRNFAA